MHVCQSHVNSSEFQIVNRGSAALKKQKIKIMRWWVVDDTTSWQNSWLWLRWWGRSTANQKVGSSKDSWARYGVGDEVAVQRSTGMDQMWKIYFLTGTMRVYLILITSQMPVEGVDMSMSTSVIIIKHAAEWKHSNKVQLSHVKVTYPRMIGINPYPTFLWWSLE